MPRFDVHQHLWPEQLVAALARRSEPPRVVGSRLDLREGSFETDLGAHDPDTRLRLLDRHEIDVAIVSFPPTIGFEEAPELAEAYEEGILEVAAASHGRIRPLACGAERDGFVGTCVSAQSVVRDPLALQGSLLFVHPGYSPPPPDGKPAWWTPVVEYTAQMQAAYAAWLAGGRSDVPIVFAIMAGGAPFQLERLRSRGDRSEVPPSVYFDTASYGRQAVDLTVAAYGVERILFGSDAPVMDPRTAIEALGSLFDTLAGENPARLFA
jgi:predicted TIM-barrel fold metal-dependent hydrolase